MQYGVKELEQQAKLFLREQAMVQDFKQHGVFFKTKKNRT